MRLTVTADTGPAAARLNGVSARMLDGRPVFEIIARDLMADERARFASSGFGQWPALDPDTIRRKAAHGHSSRILEATGTLRRALTESHAPGQRLDIRPDQMTFGLTAGDKAYYGRFHQAGHGVPKRTILSVRTRLRTEISARVRSFILQTTNRP